MIYRIMLHNQDALDMAVGKGNNVYKHKNLLLSSGWRISITVLTIAVGESSISTPENQQGDFNDPGDHDQDDL